MPDPRIWPIDSSEEIGVAVFGVSTQVLDANPARADADFTNDGKEVIYLARGNDAVVGTGIRLNPNGGSYHIGTNNLFLGIVNAISVNDEQDSTNLAVSEGNRS